MKEDLNHFFPRSLWEFPEIVLLKMTSFKNVAYLFISKFRV